MTAAGADSRANYLLKWEAIRTSREQGATSYDLWGLATGGIAHFKTGFGGREVRYIGAWDLTLDPLGRRVYERRARRPDVVGTPSPRAAGRDLGVGLPGRRLMPADALAPRPAEPAELEAWDRRMVHGPGGHVYQSRAWAPALRDARAGDRAS